MRSVAAIGAVILAGAGGAAAQQSTDPTAEIPQAFTPADPALTRDIHVDIRGLVHDIRGSGGAGAGVSDDIRDMVAGSGGNIAMRETEESIVLSVASDVLFDFDSAALTDPARETLSQIATMLVSQDGGSVQVVGHTDAKGSDDYNQTLSEERAQAVVTFLENSGVPGGRLRPVGRGETDPVAQNEIDGADNPVGRAQNRRVEFVLPR